MDVWHCVTYVVLQTSWFYNCNNSRIGGRAMDFLKTHSACITSCCKNVNWHTNFISTCTALFLGIENCCSCTAVELWCGNWHFLPFPCFSFFSNPFLYFLCLFIVSFLYFFSVSLYVFIFNFHIFRFLPLSYILAYSLLSFMLSFFSGLPHSSVWDI